jgi:hypothetical protein
MAITYEPISTYSATGSEGGTLTFSSIPQTYTDIVLVMNVKDSAGYGIVRFNGDGASTTLYSRTFMRGSGSSASSNYSANANEFYYESNTAQFVPNIFHFMNYSNTTTFKTTLMRSSDATTNGVTGVAYLYRSLSQISSIKIDVAGGNFSSGSTLTLYGIKAA